MIFEKEILSYIASLNQFLDCPEWDALYNWAVLEKIPVVRKNTARFLYFLVKIKKPERALEIGTGSGYSTLWMEKGLEESAEFTTIERDRNRFEAAKKLFESYPRIRVLCQDAFAFLKESQRTFDLVFLDAQKRDYVEYLELLENKIEKGGILFVDNFLFGGKVIQMSEEEKAFYHNGVDRLKKFNEKLSRHPAFETLFLSIDDGVIVALKR
jgi:predicted O-methyltransferase YrrM